MVKKGDPIGRLAMREEVGFWRAYYAKPDTMEGSVLLGSIRMHIVQEDPKLKEAFMELMKKAVTMILLTQDVSVSWPNPPIVAPDHERRKKKSW